MSEVLRQCLRGPGRLVTLLSDASGNESSSSSSSSSSVDIFSSLSSSSVNDTGNSTEPVYRRENHLPPWIAGMIIGICALLFTIALLVAFFNCCRGKKLLDTDEDEERLMADEYFDPEDAGTFARGFSFRSQASRYSGAGEDDVRSFGGFSAGGSDSGEDSDSSAEEPEFFAAPQPVAKPRPRAVTRGPRQPRVPQPRRQRRQMSSFQARNNSSSSSGNDSGSEGGSPDDRSTSSDSSDMYDGDLMHEFYDRSSSDSSRRR